MIPIAIGAVLVQRELLESKVNAVDYILLLGFIV